jgi:hypothetical protein
MGNYLVTETKPEQEPLLYFTAAHVAKVEKKHVTLERDIKSLESQVRYHERKVRQLQLKLSERNKFFDHLPDHVSCLDKRLQCPSLLITRVLQYAEESLTQ